MNDEIEIILNSIYPTDDYAVVIANGDFPKSGFLISVLKKAVPLLCCDGAIESLVKINIVPNYIIGDCDSLSKEIRTLFKDKIIKIPEQDTNDLTKAVMYAYNSLNIKDLIILGATGKREDHTLANIGLMVKYSSFLDQVAIISDYGIFTIHRGYSTILTVPGQQVSFFSVNPNAQLSSKGLVWELDDYQLDLWNKGSLNQAKSKSFKLTSDEMVIVYRAFDVKL